MNDYLGGIPGEVIQRLGQPLTTPAAPPGAALTPGHP